jgi:hypothetical protein
VIVMRMQQQQKPMFQKQHYDKIAELIGQKSCIV